MNKTNNIKSSFYLSLTAIIWGVAFVFQSMGNNYMEPFTFNSARNFLGFLVLIPIVLIKLRKSTQKSTAARPASPLHPCATSTPSGPMPAAE